MLINDEKYFEILNEIKVKIREAQTRAVLSVNRELILLYWSIGTDINTKSVWGNKFIVNLARDLKLDFPNSKGFSRSNLFNMTRFAKRYTDKQIVQQLVGQIPWGQNIVILDKIKDENEQTWYLKKTAENGWSRAVLIHQIELGLYQRQVLTNKVNNFKNTLPSPQSDLVQQAAKDPYIFDFVANSEELHETQIEKTLINNITKLLLELGTGFAFLGNQYHIEVGNKDYYIDLLFYNLELRCYVVIELKNKDFDPRDAGQLNFYLSAIDDLLRKEHDNPTIGLLLCKDKDNMTAEYALRNYKAPIGVAEYKLISKLPKNLENILPSAEDIKTRIRFDQCDRP